MNFRFDRTFLSRRPLRGDENSCNGSPGVPAVSRPESLLEIPGYADSFSLFPLAA